MMRLILGRALSVISSWFSTPFLWPSRACYQQSWPQVRPGKTGIAAAKRRARKARNRRRQRHGRA